MEKKWTRALRKLFIRWDGKCTECRKNIGSEKAILGYKPDGSPFYACETCGPESGAEVTTLVGRTIDYKIASDELPIWRYLSIDKLFDLMIFKRMPFIRLDSLGDPFEGSISLKCTYEEWKDRLRMTERFFHSLPCEAPDGTTSAPLTGEGLREAIETSIRKQQSFHRRYSKTHYASCWHQSDHESDAMWNLYNASVAVKSSVGRVRSALNYPWSMRAGNVTYLKYGTETLASEFRAFYKRLEFAHEKEVRFLLRDLTPRNIGPCRYVRVNIEDMIEGIVLSPKAYSWHMDLIREIVPAHIPVTTSTLKTPPFHG